VGVLKELETLVEAGRLTFPREVAREVKDVAHPDAPGVWVHGVEKKSRHPRDPDDATVRRVLAAAPDLIDPDSSHEADPYVIAVAIELEAAGHLPTVVSEDVADRPSHTSVRTACQRLHVRHARLADLINDIGL